MTQKITQHPAYKPLKQLSKRMSLKKNHLKHLITDRRRFRNFSLSIRNFFFDFSKQRIDAKVFNALIDLSIQSRARDKFSQMTTGEKVNTTEGRAALHTATRDFTRGKIHVAGQDILFNIKNVYQEISGFCKKIHQKKITANNGKPFSDAVIVGIGGSCLGCEFIYTAMKCSIPPKINLHFLANVDIDNFGTVIQKINPESCLWIVISKSYTTAETMANLKQVLFFLKKNHLNPVDHLITITAKGSPGDDLSNPVLRCFHVFDFIGGRYSVTSAVGILPLGLAFGMMPVHQFLSGCHEMDRHALQTPEGKNIPLIAALINIWNSNFLNYAASGIIPYSSVLSKLAPHIQQLYMESLGKGVTAEGEFVDYPTGMIVFGETGTNAQHSFFQLAHQGSPFPIEFIGSIKPLCGQEKIYTKGVTNHQELWANMIAQANALATGRSDEDNAKYFKGNRPSSTLILNDLSPKSIGLLLSFYEARTVYEGFILGINPFDQFGVELGKVQASDIRGEMAKRNMAPHTDSSHFDDAVRFYLNTLYKGCLD